MSKKTIIYKPKRFNDPVKAFEYVKEIYNANTSYLVDCFESYCKTPDLAKKVRAFYPYIKITTKMAKRSDSGFSYGFASRPGTYMTTLTKPDFFELYYKEQFSLIIKNHDIPLEIGTSETPIPLHFAIGDNYHLERDLSEEQVENLPLYFDVPDLNILDDEIANSTFVPRSETEPSPLALFTAPRKDISLQRLKHYCGTDSKHFQNYILFTNYQFYIDEFVQTCRDMMSKATSDEELNERKIYSAFVEPGDKIISIPGTRP